MKCTICLTVAYMQPILIRPQWLRMCNRITSEEVKAMSDTIDIKVEPKSSPHVRKLARAVIALAQQTVTKASEGKDTLPSQQETS